MRLVVDVANVVGSRPDGWWRDRAGAASRLLARLSQLVDATVAGPDGASLRVDGIDAVVEGRATAALDPDVPGLRVIRAPRDGDAAIVERAALLAADGLPTIVVTADRALRERLPAGCAPAGPGWLLRLLDADPS